MQNVWQAGLHSLTEKDVQKISVIPPQINWPLSWRMMCKISVIASFCLFLQIVIHLIQILLVIGGTRFAKNRKDAGRKGSCFLVCVRRHPVSGLPARAGIPDLFFDGASRGRFQPK